MWLCDYVVILYVLCMEVFLYFLTLFLCLSNSIYIYLIYPSIPTYLYCRKTPQGAFEGRGERVSVRPAGRAAVIV